MTNAKSMNVFNQELKSNSINAKILIVDDEIVNVKLLEKLLGLKGYQNLRSTQDPTQVLPMHLKYDFDLILLDLNMPKLDGYGVIEQLNQMTTNKLPPILVITAQNMQSFRQRALNYGVRDFITKPFDAEELLSRVHNLLEVQMAHRFMNNQNKILEEMVHERTLEIQKTRLQVIRCLGRAADYRDEETGLHIIRMSKMAVVIARATGMDEVQCDLLLNAAPMHDIGKIGIPDNILLKPGKFDKEEWLIMQSHSQIGADILSVENSDLMKMAVEIAISHHEKWDGTGYPNGLKGEEIPFVGRIAALADVFDALTSVRPYKKAWTVEKTVEHFIKEKGHHFEPKLVDVFLDKLPEIISIKEKYAESHIQKN